MVLFVHKNVRHEGEVKHLKKCRSGYIIATLQSCTSIIKNVWKLQEIRSSAKLKYKYFILKSNQYCHFFINSLTS